MWRRRAFVAGDPMRELDRFAQFVGQIDALQLVAPQADQFAAERLQRVHVPLALGLAGRARRLLGFVVRFADHRCL